MMHKSPALQTSSRSPSYFFFWATASSAIYTAAIIAIPLATTVNYLMRVLITTMKFSCLSSTRATPSFIFFHSIIQVFVLCLRMFYLFIWNFMRSKRAKTLVVWTKFLQKIMKKILETWEHLKTHTGMCIHFIWIKQNSVILCCLRGIFWPKKKKIVFILHILNIVSLIEWFYRKAPNLSKTHHPEHHDLFRIR